MVKTSVLKLKFPLSVLRRVESWMSPIGVCHRVQRAKGLDVDRARILRVVWAVVVLDRCAAAVFSACRAHATDARAEGN